MVARAEVEAADDGGEDARDAELLRRDVEQVGREQRDGDLDERVVQPAPQPGDDPSAGEADQRPDARDEQQLHDRVAEVEGAGRRGADRHAPRRERRAVVDEVLALDEVDDPFGRAEPAEDRRRGHEVGRREHRGQHEGRRPGQPVDERMRHDRDRGDRRGHEDDRAEGDGPRVAQQQPGRRLVARRVHERRHEDQEDDVRLELELRHARAARRGPARRGRGRSGTGTSSWRATQTSSATAARSAMANSISPTP